jgi:hypothetical protein
MEDITKAEKAALYFQILERCEDWKEVYKIAIGADRYNQLSDKTKQTNTSRWKFSHKIQKAREEIERNLKARDEDLINKAVQELQNNETESTEGRNRSTVSENSVNFLNPDEFLKFASQKANEIQDEKDRREYLKMIANLMNYKDSDREETEIQRFYTPVNCLECEIYKKCGSCSLSCPVCD